MSDLLDFRNFPPKMPRYSFEEIAPWGIGSTSILNLIRVAYNKCPIMGKLLLTNVSILHEMIRPLRFESKDKVCGGGDAGGAEQHICVL